MVHGDFIDYYFHQDKKSIAQLEYRYIEDLVFSLVKIILITRQLK